MGPGISNQLFFNRTEDLSVVGITILDAGLNDKQLKKKKRFHSEALSLEKIRCKIFTALDCIKLYDWL